MQAITYPSLGEVRDSKMADPVPADGELVVRVHASGLCHTDIDILHGRYGNSTFPVVPGHEYAGKVIAVGKGVTRFASGDRVVIDPNFHCGKCRPCTKGLTNLCDTLGAYGVTRAGGFADYSVVDQHNLVAIGDMPYDIAALAEPVGCALNGLDAIDTSRAENALVIGAGPIGMLLALSLRARGVADVTVVDRDESRLELAQSFALNAVAAGSDALRPYHRATDLVIDATGVPAVAQSLFDYVANGGGVLFFGVCPPGVTINVIPHDIFRRQLRVAGAHSLNHNIPEALQTIGKIGPDIARLISHRVPLGDIPGFLTHGGPRHSLKIQAVMSGD